MKIWQNYSPGETLHLGCLFPEESDLQERRDKEAWRSWKTWFKKAMAEVEKCRSLYKVNKIQSSPAPPLYQPTITLFSVCKKESRNENISMLPSSFSHLYTTKPEDLHQEIPREQEVKYFLSFEIIRKGWLIFRRISWISAGRRYRCTSSTSRSPWQLTERSSPSKLLPAMIRTRNRILIHVPRVSLYCIHLFDREK